VLAGTAGAERIDVVPLAPHRNSELDRFDRAILPDRLQKILEFADQFEG
jgi:hypothetical protein